MTGIPLEDSDTTDPVPLWQQGNKEAFGQLYDKYSPALFGVISEIVGSSKKAEIILQKTFAEIWDKRILFDACKERPFSSMFKIARNLAISSITGKGAKSALINPFVNNLVSSSDAIKIREIQSIAFKLIYYTGCTFDEAGDSLNISGDVLRMLMVNTIKQLREIVT
jgi:DNA-directed RNA polymerase specialized sigma24 family protein